MFTTVSRSVRPIPAARTAPNDEPYSTTLRSRRLYQTRCGISCTSGKAPVASEERQTGVSDGKTETARPYLPRSASAASVGADPRSIAASSIDGVNPSTTATISFLVGTLLRQRTEARVALRRPAADA